MPIVHTSNNDYMYFSASLTAYAKIKARNRGSHEDVFCGSCFLRPCQQCCLLLHKTLHDDVLFYPSASYSKGRGHSCIGVKGIRIKSEELIKYRRRCLVVIISSDRNYFLNQDIYEIQTIEKQINRTNKKEQNRFFTLAWFCR